MDQVPLLDEFTTEELRDLIRDGNRLYLQAGGVRCADGRLIGRLLVVLRSVVRSRSGGPEVIYGCEHCRERPGVGG